MASPKSLNHRLLLFARLVCAISAFALLAPLAAAAAAAPPAPATSTPNEAKAVETVAHARELAVSIQRGHLSREAEKKASNELSSLIDGQTISQFVLGEKWNEATPPQRRAFAAVVSDLVVQRLVDRLGSPLAEPFEIAATRTLDDGDVIVVTHVKFRDGHIGELDWRLHPTGSKLAVADVLVDGVSISVSARDQAQNELKSNGGSIAQLIASMRNRFRFQ
jgi:ABC-type transporter MlaC component